jgi:hypothetical protein
MPDQTLSIPQHADPIARGLLFVLVATVLGLAVALPAPPSQASTPIVIFATPALASRPLAVQPLAARLESQATAQPTQAPTEAPTELPAAEMNAPAAAPTLAPPPPAAPPAPPVSEQADAFAGGAPAEAAPVEPATDQPLIAIGPQVPEGPQQLHQQPDSTYVTVGDSPVRYYVDENGQVADIRLPGIDTAANGADIAALTRATAAPTAAPVPAPTSPRGYVPRSGYRPR